MSHSPQQGGGVHVCAGDACSTDTPCSAYAPVASVATLCLHKPEPWLR